MKSIVVIGYIGKGNIGDEICAKVLLENLAPHAVCEVLQVARHPIRELLKMRRLIRSADAVVFAGGNLLQNRTSNRSLYYYLRIIRLAKRYGVTVLFASSGIGEVLGGRHRAMTYGVLGGGVRFFGARTTHDAARAMKIRGAEVSIMPDLSFAISHDILGESENIFAYIPKSACAVPHEMIEDIKTSTGAREVVLPFFACEDFRAARIISKRDRADIYSASDFRGMSALLSKCRFVITERLHGAILALICGTPAFISRRQEKARALKYEIDERCKALGINSPLFFTDEVAVEKIKELGAKRSEFKILLDNLRCDTESGLRRLVDIIEH